MPKISERERERGVRLLLYTMKITCNNNGIKRNILIVMLMCNHS